MHGRIKILCNLIDAYNKYNLTRTIAYGGNSVAVAVNIYKNTVLGNCIGAGNIYIGTVNLDIYLSGLLRSLGKLTSDKLIVLVIKSILKTYLVQGHGSAVADRASLGDERESKLKCFLLISSIIALDETLLKSIYNLVTQNSVYLLSIGIIHNLTSICLIRAAYAALVILT